jgi:hypothetical protein
MKPSVFLQESDGNAMIVFRVAERPWTTNAERKGNRWVRAEKVSECRGTFGWLAKAQRLPLLTNARVTVELLQKGRLQDTAACNPYVKAAIDGLVDGGILLDDTPDHLVSITFCAPTRAKFDEITITIEGEIHE